MDTITYGFETWTLIKVEDIVQCFERKILSRIYGPEIENLVFRRRPSVGSL